ncbi:histidinol-phosphatase [uncultured Desulfovibrio sp.]|uniref:histidinol-phosphatase n=1 Tax=uncultured Desulfovibrio sp. TaxID=167968 RepID=UPI00261FA4D0|nr:histidinol-phosphatase [uncultured Desulfovibrio sp.]
MITIDLHTHTRYSHGRNTPDEMYAAAEAAGLRLYGFSEHSPRPLGYNYSKEYREQLAAHLPDYVREVQALKTRAAADPARCQVLFGMEFDWLSGAEDFVRQAAASQNFDYRLGSVHYLQTWGFDDKAEDWDLSQDACDRHYEAYFAAWRAMIASGLFDIAAHPDLIKIFSVQKFHTWLARPDSVALVRTALGELRDAGMAMEISSAGLRKPCREIYPCPTIMRLAAELELPVTFASDAHSVDDMAYAFPQLANYARAFGFQESVWFDNGTMHRQAF